MTRTANDRPMAQNGVLLWLKRDIAALPTNGRPLSQAQSPAAIYEIRRPMYEAFSDAAVENTDSVNDTVEAVLTVFSEISDRVRT